VIKEEEEPCRPAAILQALVSVVKGRSLAVGGELRPDVDFFLGYHLTHGDARLYLAGLLGRFGPRLAAASDGRRPLGRGRVRGKIRSKQRRRQRRFGE